MLLAVLDRDAGIAAFDQDVFVNAVGGVKIDEPAADLPVLLAIVSSLRNKALPEKMVAFGEIGLAGGKWPVGDGERSAQEKKKNWVKNSRFSTDPIPRKPGRRPE